MIACNSTISILNLLECIINAESFAKAFASHRQTALPPPPPPLKKTNPMTEPSPSDFPQHARAHISRKPKNSAKKGGRKNGNNQCHDDLPGRTRRQLKQKHSTPYINRFAD